MTPDKQRAESEAHDAAMTIVEQTVAAWRSGAIGFNTAKAVIDDALIGDSDRIVRVGKQHTPEIQS